jgi:hypothetical protein
MRRRIVLQRVKRRPAGLIESNQFAVDYRLARQLRQRHNDEGKACAEVLVIARPELNSAARLDGNRPVTVELN